jgi:hypothetical protein
MEARPLDIGYAFVLEGAVKGRCSRRLPSPDPARIMPSYGGVLVPKQTHESVSWSALLVFLQRLTNAGTSAFSSMVLGVAQTKSKRLVFEAVFRISNRQRALGRSAGWQQRLDRAPLKVSHVTEDRRLGRRQCWPPRRAHATCTTCTSVQECVHALSKYSGKGARSLIFQVTWRSCKKSVLGARQQGLLLCSPASSLDGRW